MSAKSIVNYILSEFDNKNITNTFRVLDIGCGKGELMQSLHDDLNKYWPGTHVEIYDKDEIHLTEREIEIIRLISKEYTTIEIAEELFISTHTVESHSKNIKSKLDVNSIAGIVKYALKQGLIE